MDTVASDPRTRATVDAPVLRYRAYSRRVRRMLYLGGVLQDRARPAIWSYITGLLVIFLCLSQCIMILNLCRDYTDNLTVLSKCFSLLWSFVAPILMTVCFLMKREKLIELHETLNDLFERELARNQKPEATILATLNAFNVPTCMMCLALGSTFLLFFVPVLFSIIRQFVRHTVPRRYRLPLPAKYPWPIPINGFLFYLHLLYEASTSWWLIFTVGSVDGLFGYYAFQISSILRAMSIRLMNPRSREVFSEVLGTCVQTHNQLLRCGRMLEDIWGLIIMRMFLTNAMLICALIFEASPFTDLTINQVRLFRFVSFMAIKLLQTFNYAWYGSLITNASDHFRESIYFSEWPNSSLDRHVRANIVVTMMQKPMIIKALKVSSVNVNMFTNILNTAMSYFFLLQSLDESG